MTVDPFVAMRVLFGPMPPSFVTALPRQASLLDQWCPLPLGISVVDFV
jgi:hypothetical protein